MHYNGDYPLLDRMGIMHYTAYDRPTKRLARRGPVGAFIIIVAVLAFLFALPVFASVSLVGGRTTKYVFYDFDLGFCQQFFVQRNCATSAAFPYHHELQQIGSMVTDIGASLLIDDASNDSRDYHFLGYGIEIGLRNVRNLRIRERFGVSGEQSAAQNTQIATYLPFEIGNFGHQFVGLMCECREIYGYVAGREMTGICQDKTECETEPICINLRLFGKRYFFCRYPRTLFGPHFVQLALHSSGLLIDRLVNLDHFMQLASGEDIQRESENSGGTQSTYRQILATAISWLFSFLFGIIMVKSISQSIDTGTHTLLYFIGALIGLIGGGLSRWLRSVYM